MILTILDEQHVRLQTDDEGGLAVEGNPFGPLQMLATSLALCTASVIQAYGETARLDLQTFAVDVRWEYADDPYRVGQFWMTLHLPDTLPAARHRAVLRAAETCTVHATLRHSPTIETDLVTFDSAEIQRADEHHHHHHHAEHQDDQEA
jgi:uncharacterized OsmC-like protein